MILPCRTHRARNCFDPLLFTLLVIASVALQPRHIQADPAGGETGQYTSGSTSEGIGAGRNTLGSTSEEASVSRTPPSPLRITAGVDFGYDDNVIGATAATSSSSPGSFFTRENVVLTYDRPMERTELDLIAVGRFNQYVDLGTDDKDLNVTFSLTHHFSTRLSFRADIYGAYQTEPNFQSNVGPQNVRAPHFDTKDIFSVTYYWLPRVSFVTSYTFERIKYESSAVGSSQDRFQDTLAERLQFSLTTRTSLIGEYRFLIVDYDTAPRDSTTHFALAGFDHHLTEHLSINVLGGESFRSFKDDGDTIGPYLEGKLAYQGSNHSVSWTTSYGVEQAPTTTGLGTTTLRTGLNVTYDLTSRINSKAGVYYNHSENQGPSGTSSAGSQDALQFNLGLTYTINKHFALEVDYQYTAENSTGEGTSGYSRNRYFGGLTYTY
jgi:putative salt-induced outer membrane protein YdiY